MDPVRAHVLALDSLAFVYWISCIVVGSLYILSGKSSYSLSSVHYILANPHVLSQCIAINSSMHRASNGETLLAELYARHSSRKCSETASGSGGYEVQKAV